METTPHDWHVSVGYCPSISDTKAWCNYEAGHKGAHMAPYLKQSGKEIPLGWTDEDRTPRP